ncbi:MAG: hypothetical protein RIS47_414 [Bacteroidota bacterium]|jgi:peptidoglycan/xylan/chitin deacetylase (PgdA/CDA1 family)
MNLVVHPPRLLRSFYPGGIWKIPETEKKIYLTFDDGPIPEVTYWVLSKLREYNAKATFFCVGENVERNPHIFSEIIRQGHSVGNHTFNHLNGWKTNFFSYLRNAETANGLIQSKLFRPPHGKLTFSQRNALGGKYQIVLWDVLSQDYDQTLSPEACFQNVARYATPGSVIVFHDSIKASRNLFYALPKTLEFLSREGYTFEAIKMQ